MFIDVLSELRETQVTGQKIAFKDAMMGFSAVR